MAADEKIVEMHSKLLDMVVELSADMRLLRGEVQCLRGESKEVADELRAHMSEEESEDKLLVTRIEELSAKIDSFAPITTAFIKDESGEPDYLGHRVDHSRRAEDAIESKRQWQKLKDGAFETIGKGLAYGCIAIGLFLLKDIATAWVTHPQTVTQVQQQLEEIKK